MEWWEFKGQRDKYLTLGIIAVLSFLSTSDVIADWVNYEYLNEDSFRYGLVIGPPSSDALTGLLFFNIIGTIMYLVEMWNATTLLTNARVAKLPIVFEQGLVLLLEEIPMAAINLNIVTCRMHHVTRKQVTAGVFGFLNVGVRLFLYAWYRECEYFVKVINTFKTTLKIAIYVTVSVFYMVLIVTLGFTWQTPELPYSAVKPGHPVPAWTNQVSIMFLPNIIDEPFGNDSVNIALQHGAISLHHPWLVSDISTIISTQRNKTIVTYDCPHKNTTLSPSECNDGDRLEFSFKYSSPTSEQPFGCIMYGLAILKGRECRSVGEGLHEDWLLLYLKTTYGRTRYGEPAVLVHPPWAKVCTPPIPMYDKSLNVC